MKIYKLYPILDWNYIENYKIELNSIKTIIQNCNFFQLRIKNKQMDEMLEIIHIYKNYFPFAKLILNDYYQLISYSNGLHLGIEDLKLIQNELDLKPLYPLAQNIDEWISQQNTFIFGISTHSFHQFESFYKQYKNEVGYLAIGPCFETNTKELNYSLINQKEISEILKFYQKEKLKISLVFIGGMNKTNVHILHKWIQNTEFSFENIYYASISSFLKTEIPDKMFFT